MVELQKNVELAEFLQEKVKPYNSPSVLAAQIVELNAYFAEGEKHWNKSFEDAAQACRDFEADQKALMQKEDDQDKVLKGLEENMDATRRKY